MSMVVHSFDGKIKRGAACNFEVLILLESLKSATERCVSGLVVNKTNVGREFEDNDFIGVF